MTSQNFQEIFQQQKCKISFGNLQKHSVDFRTPRFRVMDDSCSEIASSQYFKPTAQLCILFTFYRKNFDGAFILQCRFKSDF